MSKDQVKKFLDDNKSYPDTTMVKIGEFEVPIGDLRALTADERGVVAAKMKELEATEKDLKERQGKIVDLAKKAQDAYNAAEEAKKAAAGTRTVDAGADPWADPWLAPVKKAIDDRDKTIGELKTLLETTGKTIANAATIWAEDRWDRQYEAINFGTREKKPTRDELIKYATDNNLVDRHKLPDVRAAWNKMTEGERTAELVKEAEARGKELGRQELIASRVPPPGVAGPGQAAVLPKPPAAGSGDLGDLYGEAVKDPELRALLEQVGSLGVM